MNRRRLACETAPVTCPGRSSGHEDQVGDLLVGGEAILRHLGEDLFALQGDLEDPPGALDQLDLGVRVSSLDLGGQTDRLGLVVSLRAVLDRELHGDLRG